MKGNTLQQKEIASCFVLEGMPYVMKWKLLTILPNFEVCEKTKYFYFFKNI